MIGSGTYAQVKSATHIDSGKCYAVKIWKGDTSVRMLDQEASILKELNSDYFPKYHDYKFDEASNTAYLFMELIEGDTLEEIWEEKDAVIPSEATSILLQLSEAISTLHEQGIAHRDIKPQNILVTKSNVVKLIDFGISARFKPWEPKTREGVFSGSFLSQVSSPLYAAPEIRRGKGYSEAVDIWGIGIIWQIMLKNKSGQKSRFRKIKNQKSCLDLENAILIKKALSTKPDERPTASQIWMALKESVHQLV